MTEATRREAVRADAAVAEAARAEANEALPLGAPRLVFFGGIACTQDPIRSVSTRPKATNQVTALASAHSCES